MQQLVRPVQSTYPDPEEGHREGQRRVSLAFRFFFVCLLPVPIHLTISSVLELSRKRKGSEIQLTHTRSTCLSLFSSSIRWGCVCVCMASTGWNSLVTLDVDVEAELAAKYSVSLLPFLSSSITLSRAGYWDGDRSYRFVKRYKLLIPIIFLSYLVLSYCRATSDPIPRLVLRKRSRTDPIVTDSHGFQGWTTYQPIQ
jgi:hypothetical protein